MYIAIEFKGQAGCVIVCMSISLCLTTTLKLFIFTLNRVEEILRFLVNIKFKVRFQYQIKVKTDGGQSSNLLP